MNYRDIVVDHSRSKEERVQSAFQLAGNRDPDSLDALIKAMLTDPSPVVRHECAFVLGETKLFHIGKYLMQAVENDSSSIVKHEALSSLGSLGDPSSIPFIEKYLDHPDATVRDSAEMARERILRYRGGKCFT